MRHAVPGAGGVGAFLGAALARAGRDVLLLTREESLARYGVPWVTTKATHLTTQALVDGIRAGEA